MSSNDHLNPPSDGLEQMSLFRGKNRWVKRWDLSSETDEGVVYVVAVDTTGRYGCSCPAWVHDPERKQCKHIKKHLRNLEEEKKEGSSL